MLLDSDPLITVVIPTFHREALLRRALTGLLAEMTAPLEVLVIDDSPEHSAEGVVRGIDPRVRYLAMAEPTGGRPALVRNQGIRMAKGRYLYFLDDDDQVDPAGLLALVVELEAHPSAGVAYGTVTATGPDAEVVDHYDRYFGWAARRSRWLAFSSWLTVGAIMFRGTLIINSCCVIRRTCALDLDGYDEEMCVYEDVEYFTRGIRRFGHRFVDVPILVYSCGLPSIIHDLEGSTLPIHTSYQIMHRKYRDRHGALDYRLLQLTSKLLPIGSFDRTEGRRVADGWHVGAFRLTIGRRRGE